MRSSFKTGFLVIPSDASTDPGRGGDGRGLFEPTTVGRLGVVVEVEVVVVVGVVPDTGAVELDDC